MEKFRWFCILWLFAIPYGQCVRVETKQGILNGQIERSRGGREFFAFYSIPYAKPPVGDLRFEDPVTAEPWDGVRDATKLPPPCLFSLFGNVEGDEDCLYLNLYTPKPSEKSKLPVIVFIYGGRYMYGHALPSRYGPHYFMDKDVVLITFHYRQGSLGFLTTEDEVMPGNYGLKDFAAVLRWVRDNVDSFGGDKERVTVMGGSSGGQMANLALVSPLTKGLFHRCISQSGVIVNDEILKKRSKSTWKFASLVGCASEDIKTSSQLKSCLKNVPTKNLARTNELLYVKEVEPGLIFSPVVENEKIPGAFVVDEPLKLLKRSSKIPWLFGINSDDGGMGVIFSFFNHNPEHNIVGKKISENYRKYFPIILRYDDKFHDSKQLDEVSDAIKNEYFGDDDIINKPLNYSKLITNLFSLAMNTVAESYKGDKFVYVYDHKNKQSFDKYYGNPPLDLGVIHGDELISMFNWSSAITPVTEGTDLVVSEQVLNLWTNFATYGNPNGEGEEIWKPVESSTSIDYLHIKDGQLTMKSNFDKFLNHDFWKKILPDL